MPNDKKLTSETQINYTLSKIAAIKDKWSLGIKHCNINWEIYILTNVKATESIGIQTKPNKSTAEVVLSDGF